MNTSPLSRTIMAFVGAVIGGLLGYFAFLWLANMGFYALVLPGGLLGIGAGLFRSKSIAVAVVCGLAALAIGLFTEWHFRPFIADNSLGYFLSHVHELLPITLIMIALGAFIGFWAPFRNRPDAEPHH